MNILERIKVEYPVMTPAERRIADVILADPEQAVDMTIRYLSKEANVSEGTIINFAAGLGFPGFSKLKISIAGCISSFKGYSFANVYSQDSIAAGFKKITGLVVQTLNDTCEHMDGAMLERGALLLMEAKKIEAYGMAGSGFVAQDAAYRLMRIGLPCNAYTDPMFAAIAASHLDSQSVMIIISHSGNTAGVLRAAEVGISRGAKLIGITSYHKSPLAEMSDVPLVIFCDEAPQFKEAAASRIAHLLVIDVLCAYSAAQLGSQAMEHIDEAMLLIDEYGRKATDSTDN